MKKYFYIALAAATFASCSSDETLELNQEAIQFGNAFVNNSTRAATDNTYTSKTLNEFLVYGTVTGNQNNTVNIFNEAKVTRPTNLTDLDATKAWECSETQYWIQGAAYKFTAIADGKYTNENNKELIKTTTDDNGMPTSITYTASAQKDLLLATNNTVTSASATQGIVTFDFNHLLSKAKFTVENTTSTVSEWKYKVTGINITNSFASATYNIVNNSWDTSTSTTSSTTFGDITATAETNECNTEMLLIPGLTSVTVAFTLEVYHVNSNNTETLVSSTAYTGNNAKTATVTNGLLAGNAYNFKLTVGVGNQIQFTVQSLPDWVEDLNNNQQEDDDVEVSI